MAAIALLFTVSPSAGAYEILDEFVQGIGNNPDGTPRERIMYKVKYTASDGTTHIRNMSYGAMQQVKRVEKATLEAVFNSGKVLTDGTSASGATSSELNRAQAAVDRLLGRDPIGTRTPDVVDDGLKRGKRWSKISRAAKEGAGKVFSVGKLGLRGMGPIGWAITAGGVAEFAISELIVGREEQPQRPAKCEGANTFIPKKRGDVVGGGAFKDQSTLTQNGDTHPSYAVMPAAGHVLTDGNAACMTTVTVTEDQVGEGKYEEPINQTSPLSGSLSRTPFRTGRSPDSPKARDYSCETHYEDPDRRTGPYIACDIRVQYLYYNRSKPSMDVDPNAGANDAADASWRTPPNAADLARMQQALEDAAKAGDSDAAEFGEDVDAWTFPEGLPELGPGESAGVEPNPNPNPTPTPSPNPNPTPSPAPDPDPGAGGGGFPSVTIPALNLEPLKVGTTCNQFPFGVPCYVVAAVGGFGGSGHCPQWSMPTPEVLGLGDAKLDMCAAQPMVSIVRPVLLVAGVLAAVWLFVGFAYGRPSS